MIQVIQYFMGNEQGTVGNARTAPGTVKLLYKAANGDGWGSRIRGNVEDLQKIGAFETVSGWYFDWTVRGVALRVMCQVRQ